MDHFLPSNDVALVINQQAGVITMFTVLQIKVR